MLREYVEYRGFGGRTAYPTRRLRALFFATRTRKRRVRVSARVCRVRSGVG